MKQQEEKLKIRKFKSFVVHSNQNPQKNLDLQNIQKNEKKTIQMQTRFLKLN